MPYAAITYRVKPGHEKEIADIFAGFQRVSSPDIPAGSAGPAGPGSASPAANGGGAGGPAARLLGTAVFIKDDVMVRVIHYEGEWSAIGRYMAGQRGVHLLESKLAPYLVEQRDTSTPAAFGEYFQDATMRCLSQLSVQTHPAGG